VVNKKEKSMKVLIIYDSFFGNTEKIAQTIGDSLSPKNQVDVVRIGALKPEQLTGVGLLLVGSPTRAFRPTKPIIKFLKNLPKGALKDVQVAAFDTRINPAEVNSRFLNICVKLFGYAAEPIARLLVRKGGQQIIEPAGFFVKASEGPLKEGELQRATEWVKTYFK